MNAINFVRTKDPLTGDVTCTIQPACLQAYKSALAVAKVQYCALSILIPSILVSPITDDQILHEYFQIPATVDAKII